MNDNVIKTCGWDIGGAHLKFAGLNDDGAIVALEELTCRLWLGVSELATAVKAVRDKYALGNAQHAVTMTGELCDCFDNRQTGVAQIVNAVERTFGESQSYFYSLNRQWLGPADARENFRSVASANWHASANLVSKLVEDALVIDIGSTTTDIIPLKRGLVIAAGIDDYSRLKNRELVYTGVVRTPVAAIVESLPYENEFIPIVAETFATSADVYRILQLLPENADLHPTADGGDKSRLASAKRLLRMLGLDFKGDEASLHELASYVYRRQTDKVIEASEYVLSRHEMDTEKLKIVAMGCGAFLAEDIAARLSVEQLAFANLFKARDLRIIKDRSIADCAPALAVALLLHEPNWATT